MEYPRDEAPSVARCHIDVIKDPAQLSLEEAIDGKDYLIVQYMTNRPFVDIFIRRYVE